MSKVTVQVAQMHPVRAPRGALWAATIFAALLAFLQPAHGAPKAVAAQEADEANAVRDMAFALMSSDPGFAADLFAAADRHERDAETGQR